TAHGRAGQAATGDCQPRLAPREEGLRNARYAIGCGLRRGELFEPACGLNPSARGASPESRVGLTCYCTICDSTEVIPFKVHLRPGASLYEQVVYAAKKAVISGQ